MKKYLLALKSLFGLALIVFITSCTKKEGKLETKYITLSYKQTNCADAWVNLSNDSLTIKNIVKYLEPSNVYIAGMWIKQESQPETCTSCTCKTGKIIYLRTFDSDSSKARFLRVGFK